MNKIKELKYLIAIFLAIPFFCIAQPNVKIAYNIGYIGGGNINQTISEYNEVNANSLAELDKPMGDLHIASGIEIGVRFKNDIGFAYELSYENLTTDKESIGETVDGEVFSKELQALHLGLEYTGNRFGLGATVGRRTSKIEEDAITGEDRSIVRNTDYVSKIYLIWDIGGTNRLSFQLRPYVTIPYSSASLDPLRSNLGLSTSTGINEGFMTYGLTIAFYNGPQ
jgi:hypothetical protein